jgi:hypothetical protein
MTRLGSPAGETKRAEPGWYPNAHGWTRLQYWDGERWTQNYRPTSGEEQTRPGKSPAVQDLPVIEGHALFWQPKKIITVVPKEPVPVNPIGAGLALIGAALMIIGVFLPRVQSQEFFRVPDNTLIQSGDGWIFIGLAVFIAVAVYAAISRRRRTYAVLILAVLGIGIATYDGTGERLELSSLNPAAAAAVGVPGEKASPATGLYAAGAGSGLAALGGLLLAGIGSRARRLARWATRRLWTAVRIASESVESGTEGERPQRPQRPSPAHDPSVGGSSPPRAIALDTQGRCPPKRRFAFGGQRVGNTRPPTTETEVDGIVEDRFCDAENNEQPPTTATPWPIS